MTQQNHDMMKALQALANIPMEELGSGKMTLAERPDDAVICAWNKHKLTVGDVKAARRALFQLGVKNPDECPGCGRNRKTTGCGCNED